MDIIPISTKVLGKIGDGITHTLTGVYVMLTGVDSNGVQTAEFGSSEGNLKEHDREREEEIEILQDALGFFAKRRKK